jgi:hypothetical protein
MKFPIELFCYLFKFQDRWKYNCQTNTFLSLEKIHTVCAAFADDKNTHVFWDDGFINVVFEIDISDHKYFLFEKEFTRDNFSYYYKISLINQKTSKSWYCITFDNIRYECVENVNHFR